MTYTLHISKRAQNTLASPIRKFEPLIAKIQKQGIKIYELHIGDPTLKTPPKFFAAIKNYRSKQLSYAPTAGISEHVNAWIRYYATLGIPITPQNILPTVGGSEAILFAMIAVADPGDEIIIFEPCFSSYKGFAAMLGIILVPITSHTEIKQVIHPRTKAIIVINPDNPTGKVFQKKELESIVNIARRNNLFIIADETYREIVFNGKPSSILKMSKAKNCVIVVDSVSKRFSIPGARIGCVVSFNKHIIESMFNFGTMRLSVATLEQIGTVPLLKSPQHYTRTIAREYKKRRDIVVHALKTISDIRFTIPDGAFYITIALPIKNAEDFVKFLLEQFRYNGKTVMVTPLKDFYISKNSGENEIRIAYVLEPKELADAMRIFKIGLECYRKQITSNN